MFVISIWHSNCLGSSTKDVIKCRNMASVYWVNIGQFHGNIYCCMTSKAVTSFPCMLYDNKAYNKWIWFYYFLVCYFKILTTPSLVLLHNICKALNTVYQEIISILSVQSYIGWSLLFNVQTHKYYSVLNKTIPLFPIGKHCHQLKMYLILSHWLSNQ